MRRSSLPARLVAASLGALLLVGAGGPAVANPLRAEGTPQGDLASQGELAPTVTSDGPITVISSEHGSTVVWRPAERPRIGDARLEVAVDGVPSRIPLRGVRDGRFTARLPGVADLDAAQVSVVAAGRVLEGGSRAVGPQASAAKPPVSVRRPATLVADDPGVRGKHATESFTYRAPKVRVGGYPAKTEVLGRVVLPARTAKGERPLVLILHGRHGTCYSADGEEALAWPCPKGFKATPSYLGYEYLQELLASQGFATVSISANGVNAQDDAGWDGGAAARSQLVRHHLELLEKANARGGKGTLRRLKGRLNLGKTVLVGHSRGGEGVNRAAVDLARSSTAKVRGQVLVAPTDFGSQVSPGVPTTVLLPYCDGDVYDLQGQGYVDQGRYVTPQDRAMKSAVMMFGANHNYFNTEWTPGMSKAPSFDDWWDTADPACGDDAPQRLTAKQQQAAGATYVAAGVQAVQRGSNDAVRLLDGSAVRARSAGKAAVLAAGFTGSRRAVANPAGKLRVKASRGMTAVRCAGGYSDHEVLCEGLLSDAMSPHWATYSDSALVPWARAVALQWGKTGARVRLTPDAVRNVRGQRIDLRVIAAGKPGTGTFDVVLTDTKGRSLRLTPERQADVLPRSASLGSRQWAQTVRIRVPDDVRGFDATKVASMSLVATSRKGKVFVLDAFTSRLAQPKFSRANGRVPRLDVTATTKAHVTEQPSGVQRITVDVKVKGAVTRPTKVALTVLDDFGNNRERVVRIKPGQRKLTVPFDVAADGVHNPYSSAGYVVVHPVRNAAVSNYIGTIEATNDFAAPVASFPTKHVEVVQGQSVRWPVELDGLSIDTLFFYGGLIEPEAGSQLTAAHVPTSVFTSLGVPIPDPATPLSETGAYLISDIGALRTQGTLELPTRGQPRLAGPRHVAVMVYADGMSVLEDVLLTATIQPKP